MAIPNKGDCGVQEDGVIANCAEGIGSMGDLREYMEEDLTPLVRFDIFNSPEGCVVHKSQGGRPLGTYRCDMEIFSCTSSQI